MTAAVALAPAPDRPAPIRADAYPLVEWAGVAFSMSCAAPIPSPGASVPPAIDALRAFTAPRARIGVPEVPHGPVRRMQAQMCASALIPGRAWAPPGVAAWIAYGSAHEAMAGFAAGLLGECRAAGMEALRVVVRAQSAEIDGLFLDARAGDGRPALFDGPDAIGATHRIAARIAAARAMSGVLLEGGRIAIYRLDAVRLRPLGPSYEIIAHADGQAIARRIGQRGGFSA